MTPPQNPAAKPPLPLTVFDCPPLEPDPMLGRAILGYRWTELAESMREGTVSAIRLHNGEDKNSLLKACSRCGLKPVSRRVSEPDAERPGKQKIFYLVEVAREGGGSPMLSVAAGLWGTYGSLSSAVRQLLAGEAVIVPNEEMVGKVAAELGVWLRSDYRAIYNSLGRTRRERRITLLSEPATGTGGIGLSVRAPQNIVDAVKAADLERQMAKNKERSRKKKER